IARDDPTTPLNIDLTCLILLHSVRIMRCVNACFSGGWSLGPRAFQVSTEPSRFLCDHAPSLSLTFCVFFFVTSHQSRSAGRSGAAPYHVLLRHWIEGPCRGSGARQARSRNQEDRRSAAC
ncbi:predicted protein, partial [Verticillium alfalfae VaMs.102]